jgi:hypothetical protein
MRLPGSTCPAGATIRGEGSLHGIWIPLLGQRCDIDVGRADSRDSQSTG